MNGGPLSDSERTHALSQLGDRREQAPTPNDQLAEPEAPSSASADPPDPAAEAAARRERDITLVAAGALSERQTERAVAADVHADPFGGHVVEFTSVRSLHVGTVRVLPNGRAIRVVRGVRQVLDRVGVEWTPDGPRPKATE